MKTRVFLTVFTLFFISCMKDEESGTGNVGTVDNDAPIEQQDNPGSQDGTGEVDSGAEKDSEQSDADSPAGGDCTPGEERECFPGNHSLIGIGECVSGTQECSLTGYWGECVGAVGPALEGCEANGKDDDCDGTVDDLADHTDNDGDGYSRCEDDCCDVPEECPEQDPAMVNPDAFEVEDDETDNNCNGEIDEEPSCDGSLTVSKDDVPGNAVALAQAIGVCDWLENAELSLAGPPVTEHIDDSGDCDYESEDSGTCYKRDRESLDMPYFDETYQTYAVQDRFGNAMTALEGAQLSILSTGDWDNPTTNFGTATLDAGDMKTASELPHDWINAQYNCEPPEAPACNDAQAPPDGPFTNQCDGKEIPSGQDPIMLTMDITVPLNAQSFSFNLFFMSIEYPDLVCTEYNDFFVALLDSTYNEETPDAEYPNPEDKNLALDENGNPVGVNLAPAGLFRACNVNCKSMGLPGTNKWGFCEGEEMLIGTGFESETIMGQCSGSGGTGWLKVQGNVVAEETITLRLAAWERGEVEYGPDHSYDTTVVIDNFKWHPLPVTPGTTEDQR